MFSSAPYCCFSPAIEIDPSKGEDGFVLHATGDRRLLFSPLGNTPTNPILALIGITPGSQSNQFMRTVTSVGVEAAARKAAFGGSAQAEIRKLLKAHDFHKRIAIEVDSYSDLNDCPDILTTSVVKCCLKKNNGYKFAAPDIVSDRSVRHCATVRLVEELAQYPSLKWAAVFGDPAWSAISTLMYGDRSVLEHLQDVLGIRCLQFPHFANNWKQKKVFCTDAEIDTKEQKSWQMQVRQWRAEVLAI